MKKILLLSALLCAISVKLFAQSNTTASQDAGTTSIALDAGLPVGSSSNAYSVAIGADLRYTIPVAPSAAITISAGYTELIGKDFVVSYSDGNSSGTIAGRANNIGVVPVKVGAKFGAIGTTGFFGEAQLGAAFISQGVGTAFAYSPGIGYAFDSGFEAGVRYEGWVKNGTVGQVALRLAYSLR
ncbi:MAG TPA: hypothetical protein VGM63_16450 [Mucilaginibacter sp.]|jgi:hypothetical protein